MRRLSQIQTSGLDSDFSFYNLHGNGVEHPDKSLLFGRIGRQQVLDSIEETMPIVPLALVFDLDRFSLQYRYLI